MLSAAHGARSGILLALFALLVAGCDDDPFDQTWNENRTEGVVHTLGHPDDPPSTAWDLFRRQGVRVDGPDTRDEWDFAVDEEDGTMYILPPRVLGVSSRAAVHRVPDVAWEDVREAPADTAEFVGDRPVEIGEDDIYVLRTREQPDRFGRRCIFYGKLEPEEVDFELQRFVFTFDVNPVCRDRNLVPDDVDL